jgi:dihydrofolate reductase
LKHIYIDGGVTIQGFLEAGLIQHLIITRIPVLLGGGIPLFGPLSHDIRLEHEATRSFPSGMVQSEYVIVG